ncbi:OsmC family protein [Nocardioides humi]|uniref:OsmC-like protein n=1 Tax=Nocardioides humi TaxID=449461 RepID=A0ABN1ZYM1_9ACTN|nr:OsmC family protein [Nocardioides humi]
MTPAESALVQEVTIAVRPAPGRTKLIDLPVDGEVVMGMRDEVADHYRVPREDLTPHATTLDYVIGATAGCLTGTFAGMLQALGQDTRDDRLTARARGRIVKDRGVLRIDAVHVTYTLRVDESVSVSDVERAHDRHQNHCPIARSIGTSVTITTELRLS